MEKMKKMKNKVFGFGGARFLEEMGMKEYL